LGELVGLRVKRVDLLHQRITGAEQATEIDGHFTWGPPKTEAGRRTVTLPTMAAAALAEHLAAYGQRRPLLRSRRQHRVARGWHESGNRVAPRSGAEGAARL
jgi:integrase